MSNKELRLLKGFLNAEYHFIAGTDLWHHLSATQIIVMTNVGAIQILGMITTFDFEGFVDDYSTFAVSVAEPKELEDSERSGNIYLYKADKKIKDIRLVRERVAERTPGGSVWEYYTDVSIVFVFEAGSLSITKLNHHTELLQAAFADQEIPETPETRDGFVADITKTHTTERETISLRNWNFEEQ
jgi:hypothetical protein